VRSVADQSLCRGGFASGLAARKRLQIATLVAARTQGSLPCASTNRKNACYFAVSWPLAGKVHRLTRQRPAYRSCGTASEWIEAPQASASFGQGAHPFHRARRARCRRT
jgi:hypothetical protein